MRKIIYSIEGNIGSGKSTLLKSLINSMPKVTPIPEPVENWQHVAGYNLLDKYYEDPVRWGYTFQVNCVLSRMTQLSNSLDQMRSDRVYVSERSVQADKFIFARLMHKLKKLSDMEYHLYLQMFESMEKLFNKHTFKTEISDSKKSLLGKGQSYFFEESQKSTLSQVKPQSPIKYCHIYLKTSPEKCFERIKKRNRVQERNLEYSYIKELDNLHDDWLVHGQEKSLILDGQREFETDREHLNHLIGQIKSYIIENSEIVDKNFLDKKDTEEENRYQTNALHSYVN